MSRDLDRFVVVNRSGHPATAMFRTGIPVPARGGSSGRAETLGADAHPRVRRMIRMAQGRIESKSIIAWRDGWDGAHRLGIGMRDTRDQGGRVRCAYGELMHLPACLAPPAVRRRSGWPANPASTREARWHFRQSAARDRPQNAAARIAPWLHFHVAVEGGIVSFFAAQTKLRRRYRDSTLISYRDPLQRVSTDLSPHAAGTKKTHDPRAVRSVTAWTTYGLRRRG